jgi:hypothetical protein
MLPHILEMKTDQKSLSKIGETFDDVKVDKIVFGSSFFVKLTSKIMGFLHKSHITDPSDTAEDTEMVDAKKSKFGKRLTTKVFEKKKSEADAELDVGQVLKKVRVKEINYFDGISVISMRDDVLKAEAFDYT